MNIRFITNLNYILNHNHIRIPGSRVLHHIFCAVLTLNTYFFLAIKIERASFKKVSFKKCLSEKNFRFVSTVIRLHSQIPLWLYIEFGSNNYYVLCPFLCPKHTFDLKLKCHINTYSCNFYLI